MSNQAGLELRAGPKRPARGQNSSAKGNSRRIAVNAAAFSHYFSKTLSGVGTLLFAAAVIGALYLGWIKRDEEYISADTGLGYWLGIVGSLMMLVLLLYPVRKKARLLRFGRVPTWFRSHMFLGIAGPLLIIFHSNFRANSLNASVALFFMLTIVASGIVGRYLFAKIHMGLYGTKAEIKGMLGDADFMKRALGGDYEDSGRLLAELTKFEDRVLVRHTSFIASLWAFVALGWRWQKLRGRLLQEVKAAIETEGKRHGWGWNKRRKQLGLVKEHLSIYFAAVNKAARFGVYDRMFAFWHVLHMPLFFMLVLTAILHVIAVHLYAAPH
jgi:hypothetical protein